MLYDEPKPITREEAERALRTGTAEEVSAALLALTFYEPNGAWVETRCVQLANHPDVWVRRNVATCLGHLARFHHSLDLDQAVPVLKGLLEDPETFGHADDALDDIAVFFPDVRSRVQPPRSTTDM